MPDLSNQHDPIEDDLRHLAQLGEDAAGEGWNPDRVRRLGTQRRRRRAIATGVAAALAVVTLGGGVVFSATMRSGINQPDPALTPSLGPSVTATPTRTLTQANLLEVSDIATQTTDQKIVITDPSVGRSVDESTVCLTNGLKPLGATQILSRNFDLLVTGSAGKDVNSDGLPIIYTQALQFADDAAATKAYETYRTWMSQCRKVIAEKGGTPLQDPSVAKWIAVKTGVADTEGAFYEVVYRAKGQPESDGGYFESVGLTLAGDRMMVTVSITGGMDKIVSYEQSPNADGMPPHEQFGLVIAAAKRLTS